MEVMTETSLAIRISIMSLDRNTLDYTNTKRMLWIEGVFTPSTPFRVLLNAESTSRVQSFPQSLIPVLSAVCAGVIPWYAVTHAHSRYPNCPGGKDIIFIPGHFSLFFVTSSSYV